MRKLAIGFVALFFWISIPPLAAQHTGGGKAGGGSHSMSASAAPSHSGGGGARVETPRGNGGRQEGGKAIGPGRTQAPRGGFQGGWGHGYGGSVHHPMSAGHYNIHFGSNHPFHPTWGGGWRPGLGYGFGWGHGYPHFWYGGFYWGFSVWPYGMWPYFWGYDDPIYIYVNDSGDYWACNTLHPTEPVQLTEETQPETPQATGDVTVVDKTCGEPIYVDKGLAGKTCDLRTFQLPAGSHTIEVKGGHYFGEDITVLAGHALTIDVDNP